MSTKNTGGTAFPMQDSQAIHAYAAAAYDGVDQESNAEEREQVYIKARREAIGGLTIRDYFAAKCVAAMVSTINSGDDYYRMRETAQRECGGTLSDWMAQQAYIQADAMLLERDK